MVQTDNYVVVLMVEAVIPEDDPSEAVFEPAVVNFLKEVQEHAEAGDLEWLRQHGKVYEAVDAA